MSARKMPPSMQGRRAANDHRAQTRPSGARAPMDDIHFQWSIFVGLVDVEHFAVTSVNRDIHHLLVGTDDLEIVLEVAIFH